jgi:hypothetical protein
MDTSLNKVDNVEWKPRYHSWALRTLPIKWLVTKDPRVAELRGKEVLGQKGRDNR